MRHPGRGRSATTRTHGALRGLHWLPITVRRRGRELFCVLFSARCYGRARRGSAPSSDTGSDGGHLHPLMRTLTLKVVAWAGCPPCRQWGLAAHRRVNTASRRVQPPGPLQVRTPPRPPLGGIPRHEAPTRRRHAARGLHVVQNPHHFLHVGHHVTCDTWLPCRYARQNSPGTPSPPLTREKVRPATGRLMLNREKTRPARHKTLILGHFARAGRIISRYRHRQSALGELCRAHAAYRAAR